MDIANVSVDDAGAETLTNVLLNEILLHIFRFLTYEDLIIAERVCCRWKTVVETCFATEKRLKFAFSSLKDLKVLERLNRYGHSIRSLSLRVYGGDSEVNWTEEIVNRFPKIYTMELCNIKITTEGFECLSTKYCQLKNVSLHTCNFTDEGLEVFLQALPAIKSLSIYLTGNRFVTPYQQTDSSVVFSNCRSLHTLVLGGHIRCNDKFSLFRFCKECVTLRELAIERWDVPNEVLAMIRHCSLLEELRIHNCPNVVDSTLIKISQGCLNLRTVSLMRLPLVSDEGLKCFARCQHLKIFMTDIRQMTDKTLVELSNCVNLREVKVVYCNLVGDLGCAALLARCPRLALLDVKYCKRVSEITVYSAIKAVQSRINGVVLQLMLRGTSAPPRYYENCHPLLRLNNESLQPPFLPIVHFFQPLP